VHPYNFGAIDKAVYLTKILSIEKPIKIYEGDASLLINDKWIKGTASISLVWRDDPEVSVEWNGTADSAVMVNFPVLLKLAGVNYNLAGGTGRLNHWEGGISMLALNWESAKCTVMFSHICLFPKNIGQFIDSDDKIYPGRYKVLLDEWELILDSMNSCHSDSVKYCEHNKLTHFCHIRRINGESFDASDGESIMTAFHWFLSFSRAGYTMPVLLLCEGLDGKTAWKASGGMARKLTHPTGWVNSLLESNLHGKGEKCFSDAFSLNSAFHSHEPYLIRI